MSNILLAAALRAAADVLEKGGTEAANTKVEPEGKKTRGRAKTDPAESVAKETTTLEDDDLNSGTAATLDDDGLGGESEKTAPTISLDDVRKKLLELKAKDGNSERVHKVMKKYINDESKQPTVQNIPVDQYGAVVAKVAELLKK